MATTAAVEWKITVEGTDAFGEVRRQEIRIDKSWEGGVRANSRLSRLC